MNTILLVVFRHVASVMEVLTVAPHSPLFHKPQNLSGLAQAGTLSERIRLEGSTPLSWLGQGVLQRQRLYRRGGLTLESFCGHVI